MNKNNKLKLTLNKTITLLINGMFEYLEKFIAENEESNNVNVRSLVFTSKLGFKKKGVILSKN
jgi:hypothetical protein